MKSRLIAILLVAAAAPSAALAQSAQLSSQDARKIVEDGTKAWMTTYSTHDAKAIAALFLDDAVFMPPDGSPVLKGHDAIESHWAQQFQSLGGREELTVKEAIPAGADAVVAILDWAITADTGPKAGQVIRGRTANTLARTPGGWKIAAIAPQLAPAAAPATGSSSGPSSGQQQ